MGDYRDGGVVFYVAPTPTDLNGDGTLDKGLVCAINDNRFTVGWWNGEMIYIGATATSVGMGQTNTTKIINKQGKPRQGGGNYATFVCDNPLVTIRGEYRLSPVEILKGLDVVPSTLDLLGAEIKMSGEAGREYILRELIEPVKASYDYILIDSPPSLGLLTINAFTASSLVFVPLQAQYFALQGLTKLLEVIDKIQKRLNKELRVGGVFVTQYDNRKVLNRDVVATIEAHFKEEVLKTKIRDNIALAEAPTQSLDIFRYSPKSYGAEDYLSLCKEVLKIK